MLKKIWKDEERTTGKYWFQVWVPKSKGLDHVHNEYEDPSTEKSSAAKSVPPAINPANPFQANKQKPEVKLKDRLIDRLKKRNHLSTSLEEKMDYNLNHAYIPHSNSEAVLADLVTKENST
jgi:hypothetical protein